MINVDKLPQTAQDVVVYGQKMTLGGCAFNAFSIAHALGEPAMLFSPVGTGAFGDFVRRGLRSEGVEVLARTMRWRTVAATASSGGGELRCVPRSRLSL
ncbi:MAG: PfkB family carbohydrate kinase [Collinsella aerofaciens]